jgi:glycosyltransferase involved in cell wall biosynthesis
MGPAWWNSAVKDTNDILDGTFMLKARWPQEVLFRDVSLTVFSESCKISIVITCNRFLQRMRVALRNWCHQKSPSGLYEVVVVNPESPDGTHQHLCSVARSYPELRICEVAVPSGLASNKGAMINAAIPFCHGEWIWFTDADCLFPPDAVALALQYAENRAGKLLYAQRRYLSAERTDDLLSGRIDSLTDFDTLAGGVFERCHENAPWGYTQIVHRPQFRKLRYPESFDHFAHGDNHFINACKLRRIVPEQVPGLFCLHLDHPFAWYGNREFL